MNFSRFFVFVAFLLASSGLFAQSESTVLTYGDFIQLRQSRPVGKQSLSLSEISGSPYLNVKYQTGSVLTKKGVKYVHIPLRYNIYSDEMEFRNKNGNALIITSPDNIKEIKMGDTVFVYVPYLADKKLHKGYFQLLNHGAVEGLVRYRVEFQPAQQVGAYTESQPPKFIHYSPLFYVRPAGQPAVEVHKVKTLINLLGDHKKELQAFAKKENIKLRRAEDLRKILDYYNSLKN
ncbi:hypothetical protein LA303_03400 [Candidatus Sulfidibacterium hydrothermale]|uniref:hypothetical protein n=1 Tax=Candidatus Sulfidibacterium hydrothermale TaxID=2875962 RepID=UPI001F0B5BE1|nr:hypothetical protein [Candidatus Sulfidibacterium hydrothermale]UBM63030.1 hypothetical protein LA303_03400 [Candidatus Sulfidibacterium hydrothermale]